MSVIVETTIGDLIFDLYTEKRPNSCKNFLKLCKMKYYNYCLFHSVRRNFIAQSGDPTGSGKGGESVFSLCYGEQAKYFGKEVKPRIKHSTKGTISFVNNGNDQHGSQFFITLGNGLDFLDGKHTVFGQLAEGFDTLEKLNETLCDENHHPYQDIRVTHTIILEDPFPDPKGLIVPDRSPELTKEQLESGRIGADEDVDDKQGKTKEEIDKEIEEKDMKIGAKILETIGDIPDAELKPPENVLFVCKLNPVTNAEDLKIIFSRFGKIESCEIIKDQKTGDSLGYGFIEFNKVSACEKAYFKMDNVLIDDRRIHVDFCQSVAKIKWKKSASYARAVIQQETKKSELVYKMKKSSKKADKYDLLFENESREDAKRKKRTEADCDSEAIKEHKKKRRRKSVARSSEDEEYQKNKEKPAKRKRDKTEFDDEICESYRKKTSKRERDKSPKRTPKPKERSRHVSISEEESSDYEESEKPKQRRAKEHERDKKKLKIKLKDAYSSDELSETERKTDIRRKKKKSKKYSSDSESEERESRIQKTNHYRVKISKTSIHSRDADPKYQEKRKKIQKKKYYSESEDSEEESEAEYLHNKSKTKKKKKNKEISSEEDSPDEGRSSKSKIIGTKKKMLKGDKCKSLKAETKQKTKHKESESSVSSSDDSDSEQYHRKKKKVVLSKMKPKEIVKRKKKSFRHSSESDSSAESD